MDDVDTSGTISMEEEIQEGYEPSQQEIVDYAVHLGMDLAIDQRYLDIARAGLKAPLPPEWKPCQKNKDGQQDFFYKNIYTGAVNYDHPCDLIFRKKYLDAKALDNKQTSKRSGLNKFKQAIELQRDEDVLEEQEHILQERKPVGKGKVRGTIEQPKQEVQGMRPLEFGNDIEEDRSFMIESNINIRQRSNQNTQDMFYQSSNDQPPNLIKNSSLQQSAAQQEQLNQEYNQKVREYDKEQLTILSNLKDKLKQQQEKIEETYMNEQNPELAIVKKQFEERMKQQKDRFADDQNRIQRKIQETMEDSHNDEEKKLKNKSDQEIKQVEENQEKKLKSQLKTVEQDLLYQNQDQRKKIENKRKQMDDTDRRLLRELEEKRKRVKNLSDQEQQKVKADNQNKLTQIDSEALSSIRQEKDRFIRDLKEQMNPELNYLKQQINELKQDHEQVTKEIKDEFKQIKGISQSQLTKQSKHKLEDYEQIQRSKMDAELKTYYKLNYEDQRSNAVQERLKLKDQNIQQLNIDLKDYDLQVKQTLEKQKDLLQEKKKAKFHALKTQYSKSNNSKTIIYKRLDMDGKQIDKEIDLFMQLDQIQIEIETVQENIRQLQKIRDTKKDRTLELQQVSVKFELSKEAHNAELIKYELEHKLFLVEKQQEKLNQKQQELEQIQQDISAIEVKQAQPQQIQVEKIQNKQIDQMMQSVNQLKDLFLNQPQNHGESKLQQSVFVKESQLGRTMLRNKSSIAPQTADYAKQFRQWQARIVEERVKLNRQKEECKSQKLSLQASQTYLLKEQKQLRQEIQETNISYHQPNTIKKDLLRKMKGDIQIKLKYLNNKKNMLRQKDAAITQIEKIIDRQDDDPDYPQKYAQIIDNISNLYELYSNIDQNIPESPVGEEQESYNEPTPPNVIRRPPNEIKFHQDMNDLMEEQPQSYDEMSNMFNAPRMNDYQLYLANLKDRSVQPTTLQSLNPNKLVTFNAYDYDSISRQNMRKSFSEIRYQLVDHQDWLQKCKYQVHFSFTLQIVNEECVSISRISTIAQQLFYQPYKLILSYQKK